ncbi:MAG: type II secretion system F family protein [Clostridia bacterium]
MDRVFTYRARDAGGRLTQGSIRAADEAAAAEMLRAQGLFVTGLFGGQRAEAESGSGTGAPARPHVGGRLRGQDLARLSRHLCVMMQAGVGLSAALHTLAGQAESKLERRVLDVARARVDTGNPLGSALAETGAFPPLFIHMVEAGEVTGRLDEVLARLADYYEKDHDLRQRIKGALTYPAVVAGFAVIVVGVLMTFVIPRFVEVLSQSDVPLPRVTQVVFGVGRFIQTRWYIVLGVPALVGLAVSSWLRTDRGRYWYDSTVLRLPVVGRFMEKVVVVRFAQTLASLVAAGVPILQSLEIVERVVGNSRIAMGLRQVRSGVREGAGVALPLAQAEIFPPVVGQMMAIGEEGGALDTLLTKLAGFYEQEVDRGIKSLTNLIEPVVIVFLGLCVALVAASVILPMFRMVQVI